jgi:phenylpropionate dioxygenase-like ring-hydroxylating dioxygenase large terminal subunit
MLNSPLPHPAESAHWHPVAALADVHAQPVAVQLLDQSLVLWRDDAGAVQAWADQCPHRGARLSLGRVCAGRLESPYHGWQFAPSGQCVRVPALPGFVPPAGHAARVFAVQIWCELVWVCLQPGVAADPATHGAHSAQGSGHTRATQATQEAHGTQDAKVASDAIAHLPTRPLPQFEAEVDTRLRKINCGPYDVATSAPRIVENFLDMAHFGFVHEGWLGARETPEIPDYQVESTTTGLVATGCKAWQPQSNLHSTRGALVEYRYEVSGPYTAVLTKVPEAGSTAVQGWRESIALFICPLGPERSRVWFRLAVADFATDAAQLQAFQHTIFTQDQPVLESQRPACLPLDVRAEAHTAADKASAAYRRFLRQAEIRFGTC